MNPSRFHSPRELATALERGEVAHFPTAPFALPEGDELVFLLEQRLASLGHKNISYNPDTGRVAGFVSHAEDQAERLSRFFAGFSRTIRDWLDVALPLYRNGIQPDMVSFRPEEEATRRLRTTARNDLLHVDAFPNRPTQGDRILRVFANINPEDPRVWVTTEPFALLLQRYGKEAGLPGEVRQTWLDNLKDRLRRLVKPRTAGRSDYDAFMLRFHDFLKFNDRFQEQCGKTIWHFQPGSVWLAMTDACSHAVLRGKFALEHSFFISRSVLAVPEDSPIALLERMGRKKPEPARVQVAA